MKSHNHPLAQMEILFAAPGAATPAGHGFIPDPRANRRIRRQRRAQWWFERMRQVVNRALDWTPAPAARPQQIPLLLGSGRS